MKILKTFWTVFLSFCILVSLFEGISNTVVLWNVPTVQRTPAMDWSLWWPVLLFNGCIFLLIAMWVEK